MSTNTNTRHTRVHAYINIQKHKHSHVRPHTYTYIQLQLPSDDDEETDTPASAHTNSNGNEPFENVSKNTSQTVSNAPTAFINVETSFQTDDVQTIVGVVDSISDLPLQFAGKKTHVNKESLTTAVPEMW